MNRISFWPPEWAPHDATWLTWPINRSTWPNNLDAAHAEFRRFVGILSDVEQVFLIGSPDPSLDKLLRIPRVELVSILTNDCWIRDYGPTFVVCSGNPDSKKFPDSHSLRPTGRPPELVAIDWIYDGWGQKYPPFDFDQCVAKSIAEFLGIETHSSKLILEGGSIDGNGKRTAITTRCCLTKRNPGWSWNRIENEICRLLGLNRLIGLDPAPVPGDDTDGHVDQVARFVGQDHLVVSARQKNAVEPSLRDCGFDVTVLPDPGESVRYDTLIPGSYTNFYIANGILIVPQFQVPQDRTALRILRELFPKRDIIGLPSIELSVGLGSFHCLSQQQPSILLDSQERHAD